MTSWAVCSPAQRSPTPGRYVPSLSPSALPDPSLPPPQPSQGALFLQHTEALLYGFQSIAETIDVNYSDVVPGLIGLIPRISISNVQLADTVMFTIGETWLTPTFPEPRHPPPPQPQLASWALCKVGDLPARRPESAVQLADTVMFTIGETWLTPTFLEPRHPLPRSLSWPPGPCAKWETSLPAAPNQQCS